MTKRDMALTAAKIAGYHNDTKMFTRLLIEARVNRQAMNSAWCHGMSARQHGVKCGCRDCNLADSENGIDPDFYDRLGNQG